MQPTIHFLFPMSKSYVPCTRERGILIERFPGRCSWGQTVNNDTRAQSLRNVPVLPRTVDSCLIIVRKITKVLRHFEREKGHEFEHRNRSCSVAITNSLPRGIDLVAAHLLRFEPDMSRYDVPSTRNSGVIDPNVQEALEFSVIVNFLFFLKEGNVSFGILVKSNKLKYTFSFLLCTM